MREQEQAGLVLIIEDNLATFPEMVGEYLESRGFEVDYAATAWTATGWPRRTLW